MNTLPIAGGASRAPGTTLIGGVVDLRETAAHRARARHDAAGALMLRAPARRGA